MNKELQTALLAIPRHAEYYRDRIKGAQDDYYAGNTGPEGSRLTNEIIYGFQTLAQLPSAETVRVLGEFLYDHKGVDENGKTLPGFLKGTGPVCLSAANTLMKLPLKSKPVQLKPYRSSIDFEDIRPWQLWYQQIKAGNRTFSFEGDPNEYDLNGPVRAAKNPDIARVTRRPHGSEDTQTTKPARESAASPPTWIAAIIAAIIALGGWLFLRRKQAT